MSDFTHLHLHTQYSILDGASDINKLIEKVKADGMSSVAITDHGNMHGVKLFHKTAIKNGIKPILGCETYVARRSMADKSTKEDRSGYHLILLAKNQTGYNNLIKIISYSWVDGLYYRPRIDEELLFKYSEGLIVSTACLGGELPQKIMHGNIKEAEEFALKYQKVFGNDFYLEMQRHKTTDPKRQSDTFERQEEVNKAILDISAKYGIKYIATNDVHFINEEDAYAHDILIALSTGKDLDDPTRMRYSGEEYLKSQEEMKALFSDLPEALSNTIEISEKIEQYELDRKPLMPAFAMPEPFTDEGEYLRHITYEGAEQRWQEITPEIKERIDFELDTMIKMGFPGYFLIVWDFIKAAREMGVSVGPGRGSAAGSVVAYCLKITDMDPLKYGLLFERFLNPDRISMPDIDIDFDEDGRRKVLQWVVEKYGKKRVANIVTFGTMAAKMAVKDVARVLKLPLNEANRIAKLIPEKAGTTLKKALEEVPEFANEKKSSDPLIRDTIKYAFELEGSIRQTGVHACGIIISRDDLEEHVPLSTSKESDLLVTQYEGKHVEDIGLIKMDFLGLKTLSIIMDALKNIKYSKGIEIDIDNIPLDDAKVYELYSRGETTALFQFESDGMKGHLKNLKPTHFDDLIAMNALYRPGPIKYIPSFIARKNGKEKIEYDLPEMEELLQNTYGITVYQEQVMLLSQKLANFSKGDADYLRKAMGKKIFSILAELKVKFVEGAEKNGHDRKKTEKIWADWENFAHYAFNKSHSTCYAYISYQTAFLKAHYPAEYMSAVLSRNLSNIKKVTIFMDECRRMGLNVLGPDINESFNNFTVNKAGAIRFGLGGIKGVGESAVNDIIKERQENGNFKDIFDFIERVNLSSVSKKTLESLVLSGAFDQFENHRRDIFFKTVRGSELNFLEEVIKYGGKIQGEGDSAQQGLFGETVEIVKPEMPQLDENYDKINILNKEKEIIGIYLSEHPLDKFKIEIKNYCNASLEDMEELPKLKGKDIKIAGMVTEAHHGTTKSGKAFGTLTLEDYHSTHKFYMFGEDYINFKNYFTVGYNLIIKGIIQPKWGKPENEPEFKIKQVNLLSEMREKMVNSLTVEVPIESISVSFIKEFQELCSKNKGSKNLQFLIFDSDEKVGFKMFSRTHKINISNEIIDAIEKRQNLTYKIS